MKLQWGAERKREEEAGGLRWRSGRSSHGAGVVRAASEKNHPGWLSGLPGPFWPLSVWEHTMPMPGCAARGKNLLPGHPTVLEPPPKKSHRQRGGRTQVDLTELSVCFQQQQSGWATAYFISLRLSQHWPEPKKPTRELFLADLNDREKFCLKNVISHSKLAPFTAS